MVVANKMTDIDENEDLERIFNKALRLREKYMTLCFQSFPTLAKRFLHPNDNEPSIENCDSCSKYNCFLSLSSSHLTLYTSYHAVIRTNEPYFINSIF